MRITFFEHFLPTTVNGVSISSILILDLFLKNLSKQTCLYALKILVGVYTFKEHERANKALHLTAYSVRSCVAPASGSR